MPWPRSSSRIHLATLSRKYRSCVMATTVPGYSSRKRSSHAMLDVAAHILVGLELRLLRQVADAQAVGGKRLAEEVAVGAGHDAQQRRLAGAIGAEHADLRPVEEREIDAAQDLPLGRDDLAKILHDEGVFPGHFSWGPRNGPQPPHRSDRPGIAVAVLYLKLTSGCSEQAAVLRHHAAILDHTDPRASERLRGGVVADAELEL